MNLILSLIVSVALLVSPTGSLPAQPETAITWTLSDVTLDLPQGSVTLNPALRLSSAVGSEEAQLHFEIINGDNTLVPVSGKLTEDELIFSLGKSGNAYRISSADFMNLLPLDEENTAAAGVFAEVIRDYCALLSREMHDEAFVRLCSETSLAVMLESTGAEVVQTEMEVDGTTIPAARIEIEFTLENALKMLDNFMSCGVAEMENFARSYLKIFSLLGLPETPTSYMQVYDLFLQVEGNEALARDFIIPLSMTMGSQDETTYVQMQMAYELEGNSADMNFESVTHGEETSLDMNMNMTLNGEYLEYTIVGGYTGPAEAPTQISLDCYTNISSTSYVQVINAEGETEWLEVPHENSINMHMEAATEDDLTSGNFNMCTVVPIDETTTEIPMEFTFDFGETREADGSVTGTYELDCDMVGTKLAATATLNRAERQEADGSVTTHYEFGLSSNALEDSLGVSFDLNRAEGPVDDLFAGKTIRDVEELSLNLSGENLNPAAISLISDVLGLSADAVNLLSDESVAQLVNMFAGSFSQFFPSSTGLTLPMQLLPPSYAA